MITIVLENTQNYSVAPPVAACLRAVIQRTCCPPVHSAGPWGPPHVLPRGLSPALPRFFCSGTRLYNSVQEHNGGRDPQAEVGNRPCQEKSQL